MPPKPAARLFLTMFVAAALVPAIGLAAHGDTPKVPEPLALDTSLDRPSSRGIYRVRVRSLQRPYALHSKHDWSLMIEHSGAPVENAVVTVGGGMPLHMHGYPTRPTVERAAGGGYLIRNMEFSMRGWWRLKLNIVSAQGQDHVTFDLRV